MNKRAQLTAQIAKAATFDDQVRLVAALDDLDRQAVTAAREARDNDWAGDVVIQTLSPVRTHELHTASTEWMGTLDTAGSDYHSEIIAKAAIWYGGVSPEVKADSEEFVIQAHGKIRREASAYGESANQAFQAAWEYLSFLRRREGASGLPQVDQMVAPDGVSQQATPLPPDVFDNFAPEVADVNMGVSGTEDSNRNPLLQEVMGLGNGGQQETLHSEAPMPTQPDNAMTASLAIGHVMNMDQFRVLQAKEAAASKDPSKAARKTAADGDSSQSDDPRAGGGSIGSSDQGGSAAIDRLIEATGMSEADVRQRFNNPQEAVKVLDSLGDSRKAASLMTEAIFHESYGEVSRPQLAAYRKHNISPSDHDDLVRHFGEGSHSDITKWVKDQAAENGMVSTYNLGRESRGGDMQRRRDNAANGGSAWGRISGKEAASGLDQIQQTTAPDGVSQRPTPLPGDVMFPLIDDTEMNSAQLVDPDPRAAVEKVADLRDGGNNCRSCGENLSTGSHTSSNGEHAVACANCGVKNYQQKAASKTFTPSDAMSHPEFFKGYGFARRWKTGSQIVRAGTPEFEAGMYAGITDNLANQAGWLTAHAKQAASYPEFSARIAMHDRFTQRVAAAQGLRTTAAYVVAELVFEPSGHCMNCSHKIGDHTAGCNKDGCSCSRTYDAANKDFPTKSSAKMATTETDLSTSSPGTSPSPVGDTPINGPGRPGPLAGYEDPAAAGGPAPYQGAPPYGRPVVPGAIAPAQIVPPEVTHTGPPNPLANQQTVAFRRQVQANLVRLNKGR